jgi:hypothetical protein
MGTYIWSRSLPVERDRVSELSQFALSFEKKLGSAGNNPGALFDWAGSPRHKRFVRGGQGVHHFLIGVLWEDPKDFSSSWIYAAVWHGKLLWVHLRADHKTTSRGMRPGRRWVGRKSTFQQANSVIVAVLANSINYIFLVDEAELGSPPN